jgi:hypothetical protein
MEATIMQDSAKSSPEQILGVIGELGFKGRPRKRVVAALERWEKVLIDRGDVADGAEDQLRLAVDGLASAIRGNLRLHRARKKVEVRSETGTTRNEWRTTLSIDQELSVEKDIRAGLAQMNRALATLGIDGKPRQLTAAEQFWLQPESSLEPDADESASDENGVKELGSAMQSASVQSENVCKLETNLSDLDAMPNGKPESPAGRDRGTGHGENATETGIGSWD